MIYKFCCKQDCPRPPAPVMPLDALFTAHFSAFHTRVTTAANGSREECRSSTWFYYAETWHATAKKATGVICTNSRDTHIDVHLNVDDLFVELMKNTLTFKHRRLVYRDSKHTHAWRWWFKQSQKIASLVKWHAQISLLDVYTVQ